MSKSKFVPSRTVLTLFTFLTGFALPVAVAAEARVSEAYGKSPLHFEANRGQAHEDVRFLARGSGYSLYLTAGEAVLVLARPNPDAKRDAHSTPERLDTPARVTPVVLRMSLVGAAPKPPVSGLEELPGKANYFIGKDPAKWRTNVPTYAKVHYQDVYPGIDLLYYGNQRQLEYDFVVAAGADPKKIVLGFKGADKLEIGAEGELVLHAAGGVIRQRVPVIYQEIDGVRTKIEGGYVLKGANQVGFEVAAYDASQPLVIDPVLDYSTYLGGASSEQARGIAVDSAGNAYVTGFAGNFYPTTTGAFQTTSGGSDAFVTKLDPTGSALVYSTYLGGSGNDDGFGIAVDAAGSAYVTGRTDSTNFPTTAGAFDTTLVSFRDAFVTKLDPTGSSLVYSTYLGGSLGFDEGFAIAVDALGNAYVTGSTTSTDFPTTAGAFRTTSGNGGDAFVTKLNPTGSALVYSTYLTGSLGSDVGLGIAVDALDSAYVTGRTSSTSFPTTMGAFQTTSGGGNDAFVTKFNFTGSALVYSTYLGGSGTESEARIAVDALGNAYVTGLTDSTNFPTTAGAFQPSSSGGGGDAFVTKLHSSGSALVYSTYLGGSGFEQGLGIAVDALDNAYVTGVTLSNNFPTTAGAFLHNGAQDAFVTKVNPTGSALVYSTYLGGAVFDRADGIAVDALGNAYVTGITQSTNFPTTAGAFQTTFGGGFDAFVAKISDVAAPATLILTPPADTNPVATQHCVTATVRDTFGSPTPGIIVRFTVTGAVNTGGSGTTDAAGQAAFCYTGPNAPGADAITAYADTNSNTVQDTGEPAGSATKTWIAGPPATLVLTPPAATNAVGSQHCVTAAVRDALANPIPGVTVRFTVTGSINTTGSATTNASGQASFCYTGPNAPGADAITAYADTNSNTVQDTGEPAGTATKTWIAGPPATLVLTPPAATNAVGSQHCVTAAVRDALANPIPGVTVRFTVTGSINTTGSATTNASGQAPFCYMGPSLPGADAITAFADTNNNGMQNVGEPTGAASKTWVGPVTTPGCEIQIIDNGKITAANGDAAKFHGKASASATGVTSGNQRYEDLGPAQPLTVEAINVQSIVCEGTTQASIYGQATVNGAGSFFYRINVRDLGEPGKGRDTYWILLQTGYTSGEQTLEGGNVQIRRQ